MPTPFPYANPGELPIAFVVIPLIVLAGLLGQMVVAVRDLVLGRASAAWPSVTGTIDESGVVRRNRRNGYRAAITYAYSVNGRAYRGHRRHFGAEGSSFPGGAEAIAARYRVGETVRVYHHPEYAWLAVLEPGVAVTNALIRLGQAGMGLVVLTPFLRALLPTARFYLGLGG